MKCHTCGNDFEAKRPDAKFCSPKCRKAYSRKTTVDLKVGPGGTITAVKTKDTFRESLTDTDKTFYDRAIRDKLGPDYYKFNAEGSPFTRKCKHCEEEFTTTLSMLRYCCYDHYVNIEV